MHAGVRQHLALSLGSHHFGRGAPSKYTKNAEIAMFIISRSRCGSLQRLGRGRSRGSVHGLRPEHPHGHHRCCSLVSYGPRMEKLGAVGRPRCLATARHSMKLPRPIILASSGPGAPARQRRGVRWTGPEETARGGGGDVGRPWSTTMLGGGLGVGRPWSPAMPLSIPHAGDLLRDRGLPLVSAGIWSPSTCSGS